MYRTGVSGKIIILNAKGLFNLMSVYELFKGFEKINNFVSGKVSNPYIIETQENTDLYKKFVIKAIIDNVKEFDEYVEEVNKVVENGNDYQKLSTYLNENKVDSYKMESVGYIKCLLVEDVIKVSIHLGDKLLKEFNYSHDNLIDDYMFYLENDLSEIIKKQYNTI
ncbi:hypothetical protein ACIQGW_15885 [Lysinibacillus xylanilyticus]|uniref:hypothetical protein n=1 Tax=Lysinibacillus xylanilyticus TaxID=582475 RepID=UPI003824D879